MLGNQEEILQTGQATEKQEKVLENPEETLRRYQAIEILETIETLETLETQENLGGIEKTQEIEEMHKEVEEEIMTLDRRDSIQMIVQEEKIEEEITEGTMALREPNPMAIGIHEISAKRFHAWGNL